jgi:hypothetical protein
VYRLKITLLGVNPPIWRRFQVPAGITLERLHDVIQTVMGWSDCHLHEFYIGRKRYGPRDADPEGEVLDERVATLSAALFLSGGPILYTYDFGDSWEHELELEETLPAPPGAAGTRPVCLAGERRCPPEDCGGFFGYAEFLKAIRNRRHPDHQEMLEWVGGSFDPESFDLERINRVLAAQFRGR